MKLLTVYITDTQKEWLGGEDNVSKLIRDLLQSHIEFKKPKTLKEKKLELKRLQAKAEYERKLKEINGTR